MAIVNPQSKDKTARPASSQMRNRFTPALYRASVDKLHQFLKLPYMIGQSRLH
jgi:hypothetical protein